MPLQNLNLPDSFPAPSSDHTISTTHFFLFPSPNKPTPFCLLRHHPLSYKVLIIWWWSLIFQGLIPSHTSSRYVTAPNFSVCLRVTWNNIATSLGIHVLAVPGRCPCRRAWFQVRERSSICCFLRFTLFDGFFNPIGFWWSVSGPHV
jgi:hypothetical protein